VKYAPLVLLLSLFLLAGCIQQQAEEATPQPETSTLEEEPHEEAGEAHEEATIVSEGVPSVTVVLKNFEFSPSNIDVEEGQIIEFKNEEGVHTVTISEAGHDEPLIDIELSSADSVLVKFNEAGSFDLKCRYHPNMVGKIVAL